MLAGKLSTITPSYTIGISSKVSELRAAGKSIIDLSIGEPDFYTPDSGKLVAKNAIDENRSKYDLVPGLLSLRQAICDKLERENQVHYAPSEIVVSSGAKNALTNTLMAVLDPGDEVIIPAPYWTSYPEMVKLCGGVPKIVSTEAENDYKLTLEQLKSALTPKTKLLLINNPSNPTGAVYTKEELEPLVNYCVEKSLLILADEIYEKIHFDAPFTSIPSLSEAAKDITILVNGFSKSAAMTGWRLGYTASNGLLAKAMSTIQGHLISHPSTIAQWAGLGVLQDGDEAMRQMVETYKSRRNALVPLLDDLPNTTYVYPKGAFYLFISLTHYRPYLPNDTSFSMAISNRLLEDYGVAVVPGIAFGNDDCIRISYATKLEWVVEGLQKISHFLKSLEEMAK